MSFPEPHSGRNVDAVPLADRSDLLDRIGGVEATADHLLQPVEQLPRVATAERGRWPDRRR